MRVILASASPRRRQLLARVCEQFEIITADVDESYVATAPQDVVTELARKKAVAVAEKCGSEEDLLIIAADTIVVLDGNILGKPTDVEDARRMLSALSARTHVVYTGVCLLCNGEETLFFDHSEVTMKNLSARDIEDYIASGSPMDKAGAYGMQDDCVVQSFNGSASNIVGFPVEKFLEVTEAKGYYGKIRNRS